jgi:hypothetical protein
MTPVAQAALLSPAALGGWTLLAVAGAWALRDAWAQPTALSPGWKWWALIAAILLAFRWPLVWVPHQFNPDESQLIAGAITLRHDPVFWRSVDGSTAGPVDYYPLLPAAWGNGYASYAIARLIGLAAVFGTIFFAGKTLAAIARTTVARVAVLPALAFHALTTNPDFTHYSTELMPVLLLAAAGYAAVGRGSAPSPGRLWTVGLLLGSVPWAKPQAAPLAVALWAFVALRETVARRPRAWIPLVAGSLLPAVVCFAAVTLTGQTQHMVLPFLVRNLGYVREAPLPWGDRVVLQWQNALTDGFLGLWLAGTAAFVVPALLGIRRAPAALRRVTLAAGVLLAVSAWSVVTPSRPSTHHLLFLVLPLMWMAGTALALAWPRADAPRRPLKGLLIAVLFLACGVLPQLVWRARAGDAFAFFTTAPVRPAHLQLTELVRRFSAPDEPIAIWGWRCSLYVEAARRQATRQAQTEAQIYANPLQSYFLRRYFEDFQAANPPVFADAVGPGNFAFENRARAHESFPPLRAWVQARYTLIADLDGTRLYVRNDRLAATP